MCETGWPDHCVLGDHAIQRLRRGTRTTPTHRIDGVNGEHDRRIWPALEPPHHMRDKLVEPVQVAPREARTALTRMGMALDEAGPEVVRALDDQGPGGIPKL